jgi:hypothetical protein
MLVLWIVMLSGHAYRHERFRGMYLSPSPELKMEALWFSIIYLQGFNDQKTSINIFTALRTSLTVVGVVLDIS